MEDTDAFLLSSAMAHEDSLPQNTDDDTTMNPQHATFAPEWSTNDAAHFAPSHLPLSKVQRAWDRRPQSPFSRKKVRFGKVWKRTNPAPAFSQGSGMFGELSALSAFGQDSPAKVVKKMRVGKCGEELVRDWEGRGSPANRRIVTRSNAAKEQLVELDEDEEIGIHDTITDEEEVVSKVEVSYEDGRVEQLEIHEELAQDEWEDESVTEEDMDGWDRLREQHEIDFAEDSNARPDHQKSELALLEDEGPASQILNQQPAEGAEDSLPKNQTQETPLKEHEEISTSADSNFHLGETDQVADAPVCQLSARPLSNVTHPNYAIPDGFVSPVKGRRRPISQVRQHSQTNRRKTLPVNFSTVEARTHEPQVSPAENPEMSALPPDEKDSPDREAISRDDESIAEQSVEYISEEPEENSENAVERDQPEKIDESESDRSSTPETSLGEGWVATVENTPNENDDDEITLQINPTITALAEEQASPSKSSLSPVRDITGKHPRLCQRRSPRRKSSSPLRRSGILPSAERSHLIAFTPIKSAAPSVYTEQSTLLSSPLPDNSGGLLDDGNVDEALSQPARSSSAPPEEPRMSPRKPFQPRMSDDTATLQAFIKRAEESKNGTRVSMTGHESQEDHRNSDTIWQALASPGAKPEPADALADLDPNSPFPRKQVASTEAEEKPAAAQDDEEQTSPTKKPSRRSGRTKKRTQILPATTYSGPTKISVRGSTDSVLLKKTEAQELAALTRTNTRRNKGGAVLPPLRLTKMTQDATEGSPETSETAVEVEQPGEKAVKWSETLVSFYHGDNELEASMMTDELNGPEPVQEGMLQTSKTELIGAPTVPPPSETPSKPRLHRLKPPRTASNPTKGVPATQSSAKADEQFDAVPKAKPTTKRRTRIATPAKLNGASLLPDGLEEERNSSAKTLATKKKVISKLPAPKPIASGLAQGKENSLIASPPKKRAKLQDSHPPTNPTSVKAFALKLDDIKPLTASDKKPVESSDGMFGSTSPAKKGVRPVFFASVDENGVARPSREDLPPSFGSPAKKRTRRTVG